MSITGPLCINQCIRQVSLSCTGEKTKTAIARCHTDCNAAEPGHRAGAFIGSNITTELGCNDTAEEALVETTRNMLVASTLAFMARFSSPPSSPGSPATRPERVPVQNPNPICLPDMDPEPIGIALVLRIMQLGAQKLIEAGSQMRPAVPTLLLHVLQPHIKESGPLIQ